MQTFTGLFGVQGSGKSFEIVKNIIVPALRDTERRVVANIDGLNADAISEYLGKDVRDRVVLYDDEDIIKPGFIPTTPEVDDPTTSKATVQPGDLLIVDEAARYFGSTKKPPEHVVDFIRMARHYTSDDGMPCNIVVAAQALTMIHKDLRSMLSTVTKCRKHIDIGKPDRYVVHTYSGDRPVRDALSNVSQEKYTPEIFPLYKSHAGAAGKEVLVDNRVNYLKGNEFKRMKIGIVLCALLGLCFLYFGYRIYSRATAKTKPTTDQVVGVPSADGAPVAGNVSTTASPSASKTRRIVGVIVASTGREFMMLDTPEGMLLKPSDLAQRTDAGMIYEQDGYRYSSLAPFDSGSGKPSTFGAH